MKLAALAVAVAAVAAPLPALAGDRDSRGEFSVGYGDLDLSSAQGQDALVARIARAAHEACRSTDHQPVTARRACEAEMTAAFHDAATGEAREALTEVRARGAVRSATFAAR